MDNATLQAFYQDHKTWLQNWLTRKLGCRLDAADITQDTFVKVLSRPQKQNIHQPRAYLTTIAHGLMVNHLRRKDIERAYLDALESQPERYAASAEHQALVIETLAEIDAVLNGLPDKARRAFLLSQLEGLKYSEMAEQVGVSVSMVKKYMLQAITHCMKIERPTE